MLLLWEVPDLGHCYCVKSQIWDIVIITSEIWDVVIVGSPRSGTRKMIKMRSPIWDMNLAEVPDLWDRDFEDLN